MDFTSESSSIVLLPEAEIPHPLDSELAQTTTTCAWEWNNGLFTLQEDLPPEVETVFLVADSDLDPADQIEATKSFLGLRDLALGRILTLVHCGLAEAKPELIPWYQGCIHFSDVALLNRRENVSQKWIREFQDGFRQEYFPCFFELVKKGCVENSLHVLDPTPRRLSLFFEEDDETLVEENSGTPDLPIEDPYLAKYPSGHRCKPLPDAKSILDSNPQTRSA